MAGKAGEMAGNTRQSYSFQTAIFTSSGYGPLVLPPDRNSSRPAVKSPETSDAATVATSVSSLVLFSRVSLSGRHVAPPPGGVPERPLELTFRRGARPPSKATSSGSSATRFRTSSNARLLPS
ncbi:hypothetical protein EUGRSUZ_E02457 [Eucalyptus grandis]|uniref:Uncharacterized protein n=2 Tax=Eucalyptus grandis TaxID=71139 RepID=A0ACC3KW97_EUCGR|nr:hypothetical protein EUGRSUZ_E02457 [Eucalyptus grandis]